MYVVGARKNWLNEMVLLSIQNTFKLVNKKAFKILRSKSLLTVKPVLRGHSKINKTKVFKTTGSLMKVESIAECSLGALFCS